MSSVPGGDGGLTDAVQAMMMLRSEMAQREARLHASFDRQVQSLQQEVRQFRQDMSNLVGSASTQIAKEAKDAVTPVAAQYDRAVSATSAQLQKASKTVWVWFGAASAILLLALFAGWLVSSWYWHQLSTAKEELSRYQNAQNVVEAFYASDALLCGGRICVNVDPNGQRLGNERQQYRQAKPRAQ